MSLIDKKNHTLKNKVTSRLVESIFSELEIKNTLFSLMESFVVVSIDKVANVSFICNISLP